MLIPEHTLTADSFERNKREKKPKNENETIKLKSFQYLRNIFPTLAGDKKKVFSSKYVY